MSSFGFALIIAAVIALIDVVNARGRVFTPWAVVLIVVALIVLK